MSAFDDITDHLLWEDSKTLNYDFDVKKTFSIIDGAEREFIKRLDDLKASKPKILQPSGLPASKRPMYQVGELAGSMSDPRLWADILLNYFEAHQDAGNFDLKTILRNCHVKPNDMAMHNFFKDMKEQFGDITEYHLPAKTDVKRKFNPSRRNYFFDVLMKSLSKD